MDINRLKQLAGLNESVILENISVPGYIPVKYLDRRELTNDQMIKLNSMQGQGTKIPVSKKIVKALRSKDASNDTSKNLMGYKNSDGEVALLQIIQNSKDNSFELIVKGTTTAVRDSWVAYLTRVSQQADPRHDQIQIMKKLGT